MGLTITDTLALITLPFTLLPTIFISIPFALDLKRRRPHKSFLKCFLTYFCAPLRYFRVGYFALEDKDVYEEALKAAIKSTGLHDLGDMTFIEIYKSVDRNIKFKLSSIGFVQKFLQLTKALFTRRLKFIKFLKDNPAVKEVPVPTPIFVIGMPRCGTTLLHRLLSADPKVRSPRAWELFKPVPEHLRCDFRNASAEEKAADREKRADEVKRLLKLHDANEIRQMHELKYDGPEECIIFTAISMPPITHQTSVAMTAKWRTSTEGIKTYKLYREFLQSLVFQDGNLPQRWMLKAPNHLYWLKEIKEVFPDAKFIWTHRDPSEAIISRFSLARAVHFSMYEEEGFDSAQFGRDGLVHCAEMVHNALDVMKSEEFKCCQYKHIMYEDIIKSPIDTVKAVYAEFGWEFTEEYETILKNLLEKDKVEREELKASGGGIVHKYSAEEFGLTNQQILDIFDSYIKEIKIPLKQRTSV